MRITPHYRTDLTEKQWRIIRKWIPQQKKGPKQVCRRRIINAIFPRWPQKNLRPIPAIKWRRQLAALVGIEFYHPD